MKKSFTLIEVLIAIAIFSLLFLAEISFLTNLKIFKSSIKKPSFDYTKVLYYDILLSKSIKIKKDELIIKTSNSLYNLPFTTVRWFVNKNALIRTEGEKNRIFSKIDLMKNNIKRFKVFKKEDKILIFVNDLAFLVYK